MSNKSFTLILIESVIIGLALIPFTYITGYIAKFITKKPTLPDVCSKWNEYYIMEVNLFLAGFLLHLAFVYSGLV